MGVFFAFVGLLNLYHAMEGENHTLLVFVKLQEMALYHKAWPNHVIVGLPASADNQGLGAARYYIKVMDSSHEMEVFIQFCVHASPKLILFSPRDIYENSTCEHRGRYVKVNKSFGGFRTVKFLK